MGLISCPDIFTITDFSDFQLHENWSKHDKPALVIYTNMNIQFSTQISRPGWWQLISLIPEFLCHKFGVRIKLLAGCGREGLFVLDLLAIIIVINLTYGPFQMCVNNVLKQKIWHLANYSFRNLLCCCSECTSVNEIQMKNGKIKSLVGVLLTIHVLTMIIIWGSV